MVAFGVITCQILELEFAHILSNDPDIQHIWVVRDAYSAELIRLLENDGRKQVHCIADVDAFTAVAGHGVSVLVRVMELGLHTRIDVLRTTVTQAVGGMAPFVKAVLLGYGLCGNAFGNADVLFKDIDVPVVFPMDKEGPVDDCVCLIIGGREHYYAEQCKCAGTMFMNAGFSRHLDKLMWSGVPEKLAHRKKAVLNRMMRDYKRSLLLPTPVADEAQLRRNTRHFNEKYDLKTEIRPGTLAILEQAIEDTKKIRPD